MKDIQDDPETEMNQEDRPSYPTILTQPDFTLLSYDEEEEPERYERKRRKQKIYQHTPGREIDRSDRESCYREEKSMIVEDGEKSED